MRILIVTRFFGSQQVPTARMVGDVVDVLLRDGHEVTVLSTRGAYARGETREDARRDRLRVIHALSGPDRMRLLNWLLFWAQAKVLVPLLRWQRCVLLTDPPFMTPIALPARWLGRKRKVYWWTMDLYPEALSASGMFRPGSLPDRIGWWLNEIGLRGLDGVIALGPRQAERLATYRRWRGVADAATIVPPWDLRPLPEVAEADNPVIAAHHWSGKRVVLYAGNLGMGHTFSDAVEAARLLHERGDTAWHFAFVCRGARRGALEREAAGLPNVEVMDYVPADQTAALLWSASVHLITMEDGWDGIVVPSKLYGALHTRAPILFIGPTRADTAQEIQGLGRGGVLPNGCGGEAVAAALGRLAEQGGGEPVRATDAPARVAGWVTR